MTRTRRNDGDDRGARLERAEVRRRPDRFTTADRADMTALERELERVETGTARRLLRLFGAALADARAAGFDTHE